MIKTKKLFAALSVLPFVAMTAGAAHAGIGDLADTVTDNLGPFVDMIMIAAFIGGILFAVQAVLKMKDAKENPRDNSAGTITLHWVAAIFLIFLGGGIFMIQDTLGVADSNISGDQSVTYGTP